MSIFVHMRSLFYFIIVMVFFSSCKVFKSNLMLRTPRNYNYDHLVDSLSRQDYKIAPNDILSYRVIANEGYKLVDVTSNASNFMAFPTIEVKVESDGSTKLPLVGKVQLSGLNIVEAENLLEEKYSKYYIKPFITLRVTNKRIIVFPGLAGAAKVLPINNNNTTIMEALAMAGGISNDGKAYKIKLIRNIPGESTKVYLMDLSRIEGITAANTMVQAYDIIYVEPRYRPIRTLSGEVAPFLTLLTTGIILVSLFSK